VSDRPQVLIGPSSFGESDAAPRRALLEAGFDIVDNPHRRKLTREELSTLLTPDVVGLVAGREPLDRPVLERSRLRAISRCGSGISNVDLTAARELGIAVRSTPDAPVDAVAELTIGALLELLRQLSRMTAALHEGHWDKVIGGQIAGRTVAVVGCGRIGRRVAELLAAFHARVIGVDPAPPPGLPFPVVALEEALSRADVVTLHVSGQGEVIGAAELARLRRGAILLNASRGGVVDEYALAEAVAEGRVAGAWLDCFTSEPYSGPLCRFPQVLLTPHVGSYTRECRLKMELEAARNLIDALRQPLP
jgi:D-3-phosphoglycerate dehydrogenase